MQRCPGFVLVWRVRRGKFRRWRVRPALRAAMAQGNGGQCLLLFPEHDLLIVTQAGYYNRFPEMMTLPHKLARKYILSAVGIRDADLVRSR
jgi:hypothetical protein